ncbi:MAG: DUF1700 domain-containing protein [Bacillota bacterium]|nr:DUF1700 domain-containing protein [Bacillota bacterium]MDW7683683.1 DUF1700 domain-containing protein [Bacillota bacterium]
MNRQEFIDTLNRLLNQLSAADRDEIIYDYQEHFRIGLEEGKSEEQIAASLGDPKVIAKQFHVDYLVKRAEEDTSVTNTFKAVLATLGLGFFNLVVVLGPFLGLAGAILGLFVASGAIIIAGIAVFGAAIFGPVLPLSFNAGYAMTFNPAAMLFLSVGLVCLGLLFLIGNVYLAKYFFIGTVQYLKFNMKIIKGA